MYFHSSTFIYNLRILEEETINILVLNLHLLNTHFLHKLREYPYLVLHIVNCSFFLAQFLLIRFLCCSCQVIVITLCVMLCNSAFMSYY